MCVYIQYMFTYTYNVCLFSALALLKASSAIDKQTNEATYSTCTHSHIAHIYTYEYMYMYISLTCPMQLLFFFGNQWLLALCMYMYIYMWSPQLTRSSICQNTSCTLGTSWAVYSLAVVVHYNVHTCNVRVQCMLCSCGCCSRPTSCSCALSTLS